MNLEKAIVNKRIPKNRFSFAMPEVESIFWRYKISKETTGIGDSDDYKELQVMEIVFKEKPKLNYFIKIQKSIPYKILYMYNYKDSKYFAMALDKVIIETEKVLIENDKLCFDSLYIKSLIVRLYEYITNIKQREAESIEEYEERYVEIYSLRKRIESLQKLIDSEKQPKKKFEYNEEMRTRSEELGARSLGDRG